MPPGLDRDIQNLSFAIDGAPEINQASINLQSDFIKMPRCVRLLALPQFDRRTSRSTPTTVLGIYGKRKLKTLARARPPIVNSSRYSATCQPTSWVRWPRSRATTVRQNVQTA
jgi:hypothetical protein